MNVYRSPPSVLPSLRLLSAPFPGDGPREEWNDDVDEVVAQLRAAAAPCPVFASGPDLRGPRNPRPPRDIHA